MKQFCRMQTERGWDNKMANHDIVDTGAMIDLRCVVSVCVFLLYQRYEVWEACLKHNIIA